MGWCRVFREGVGKGKAWVLGVGLSGSWGFVRLDKGMVWSLRLLAFGLGLLDRRMAFRTTIPSRRFGCR